VFLMVNDLLVPIAAVELRHGSHHGAPIVAIFHAEASAAGQRFRMPDLTAWASHVDDHVRVVVLDLANVQGMGERSAFELRALLFHLREEGRQLVLAGVGPTQLATMQHAGVLLDFDADDLCGDLHTAALRAERLAEQAAADAAEDGR
jgi:anti-anti-sigma regulatory factor